MRTWAGLPLNVPLTDIEEVEGVVKFKVCGGLIEVERPDKPIVTELTPTSLRLSWNSVDKAVDYVVSIRKQGDEEEWIVDHAGEKTTYYVEERLEPSCDYVCAIQAIGPDGFVSDMSEETEVTTPEMTFEYMRPVALDAEINSDGSFIAHWEPLDGADRYEINVWGIDKGDPYCQKEGFDLGTASLPEGWSQSGCIALSNSAYAGEGAPSLKMTPGAWIETVSFDDDVKSLSVWMRGISSKEDAKLEVEALCNNEWVTWESIGISSGDGHIASLNEAPQGCRAVRLTFISSGGSLAIDDLTINWGAQDMLVAEPCYSPADAGNSNHLTVNPESDYLRYVYSVTAFKDDCRSLPSRLIEVSIPSVVEPVGCNDAKISINGHTIVITAGSTDCEVLIADITGTTLVGRIIKAASSFEFNAGHPGVLITRLGNETYKIVIK